MRERSEPLEDRRLPWTRKLLWGLVVTTVFFGALEIGLGLSGVEPYAYGHDPYVGFTSSLPLFERTSGDDGDGYETSTNKADWFNFQRFPAVKGAGVVRIFCVGGSTTYGRPYDDATSFCGWLRELLPVYDGSRRWEVINAGGISYASYRVAKLMEELAGYSPDVFVIYTGHNEFLEERTYRDIIGTPRAVSSLVTLASRTRLFSVMRRARDAALEASGPVELSGEVETVLDSWIGPDSYERDDEQRVRILDHYAFNLHRMVEIAESVGALPLLVTPASNLRDCEPFRSQPLDSTTPADRARIDALLAAAAQRERSGDPAAALPLLEEALALDDRVAETHFRLGRALYALGDFDRAEVALRRARDEDVCPLRALDRAIETVRETAAATGAPLFDYAKTLSAQPPGGIPGNELFLDHVHPTIAGNRLLALGILATLGAEKVARPGATWNDAASDEVAARVRARIDPVAHAVALRNLAKVLSWAGKTDEPKRLALEALETLPRDAEALFVVGAAAQRQGATDDAAEYYRRTLAADAGFHKAHQNLGGLLFQAGDLAGAEKHFRAAIELRPEVADGPVNLGAVLADSGRFPEAIEVYRRAIELAPELPAPRYELAWLLAESGESAEALELLGPVVEDRSPAHLHYTLGLALFQRDRHARAHEQLTAALALRPDDADTHNSLGVVATRLGRRDEAVAHFRACLRLAPSHPQARANLEALGVAAEK